MPNIEERKSSLLSWWMHMGHLETSSDMQHIIHSCCTPTRGRPPFSLHFYFCFFLSHGDEKFSILWSYPFCTAIFALITLFFSTIAGTKSIENHRAANVRTHMQYYVLSLLCWGRRGIGMKCLWMSIIHGLPLSLTSLLFFLCASHVTLSTYDQNDWYHHHHHQQQQSRTYGQRNQGRSYSSSGPKKPGANIRQINRLGNANCPTGGGWAR